MIAADPGALHLPRSWTLPVLLILLTLTNALFNSLASAFGYGFPFDTFVFSSNDLFADFLKSTLSYPGPAISNIEHWPPLYQNYLQNNPYGGLKALQENQLNNLHGMPLPTLILLFARQALSIIDPNALTAVFFATSVLPLVAFVSRYTRICAAGAITGVAFLCSYPLIFAITRGNITAILLSEALIAAVLLIWHGRAIWAVALLLAIAINLRPNSAVFLALPLVRWTFRETVLCATGALLAAMALFFSTLALSGALYPAYTLANFVQAVSVYREIYMLHDAGLAYGSSLLGALKFVALLFGLSAASVDLEFISALVCSIAVGAWLVLAVLKRWTPWSGIISFVPLYALLSGVFGDYHLIVFFAIFLIAVRGDVEISKAQLLLSGILIVLILAPKNYFFVHGISAQVLLNPMLLLALASQEFIRASAKPEVRCATAARRE